MNGAYRRLPFVEARFVHFLISKRQTTDLDTRFQQPHPLLRLPRDQETHSVKAPLFRSNCLLPIEE